MAVKAALILSSFFCCWLATCERISLAEESLVWEMPLNEKQTNRVKVNDKRKNVRIREYIKWTLIKKCYIL